MFHIFPIFPFFPHFSPVFPIFPHFRFRFPVSEFRFRLEVPCCRSLPWRFPVSGFPFPVWTLPKAVSGSLLDDTALGKLLTEAHREYADYSSPEGVSVSQSSLSVVFDRTGKPVGEKCRSVNWFWCHEKHVQCSQQVF